MDVATNCLCLTTTILQSTNRTDLSSMNNLVESQECTVNSEFARQFLSSDSKSVNDHDMSDSIVPFDTSIETIALADLSALTSGGAPKRRRSTRTPGGASLDVLLGLGCSGDGASDSEGDDMNSIKRESLSPVDSVLRVAHSLIHNGNSAPQRYDLSARVSSLLSSANFNVPSKLTKRKLPAGKKRVTRIQVGVSDVFSDDEEEAVQSGSIEGMEAVQSATIEGMETAQSAPMESSIVEMTIDTTESDFFADSKDVEITGSTLPRRSSTVRISVVSFAGISAVSSEEVSSCVEMDCDLTSVAFSTSTSGCRRSCRLSNASSSGSTKKARRQATPYAPRFARPNLGTSGSAKTSMDVMREDCGYGSYFNSMNSPDKVRSIYLCFSALSVDLTMF